MYVVISTPQSGTTRDTLWLAGAVRQLRFGFCQMGRLVSRPLKGGEKQTRIAVLLLLFAAVSSSEARAQQVEPSLPLSQRSTINLAAGVPAYIGDATSASNAPQSQWWYENTRDSATYSIANFTESSDGSANWQQVGLPYDANITRTFINQTSGGGQGSLTGNANWYRLHFKVDPKYAGQKFMLELEGSHTGCRTISIALCVRTSVR